MNGLDYCNVLPQKDQLEQGRRGVEQSVLRGHPYQRTGGWDRAVDPLQQQSRRPDKGRAGDTHPPAVVSVSYDSQ